MSRSTVYTVDQLRSIPVGTTLALADRIPVVKVEDRIYATPSEPGMGGAWSYYDEDELTGVAQGDPDASWLGRLTISEIPSTVTYTIADLPEPS